MNMKWDKVLARLGLSLATLLSCILFATITTAEQSSACSREGEAITINGETLSISWREWQSNGETHLGITDAAAQQRFGLELLSNKEPHQQPVWWFRSDQGSAYALSAQHFGANRYVDLKPIFNESAEEIRFSANRLEITPHTSQLQNIRTGKHPWGDRIVVDLDRPILSQFKQTRQQATVMLSAKTPPSVADKFSSQQENAPLFTVKPQGETTKLEINLPTASQLDIHTLANPTRLVIDIRSDWLKPREIRWGQGVTWKQDYQSGFAVSWLELESPQNFNLTPIWNPGKQLEGIARLSEMGKRNEVSMAINGGFFSRDTQQPLGGIKQDGQWYSSPILNRGAIAWDNQGNFIMDRLQYRETVVTDNGETFSLQALNSGYAQSGVARYTPKWGSYYTPVREEETVVVVDDQQVQRLTSDQQQIPIPSDGYLLAIRGHHPQAIAALNKGTPLELQKQTIPSNFESYPYTLAAGPLLIKEGQVVLDAQREAFSDNFIQQKAHRSAIALTEDETILLVTIGNNQQGQGPTLAQMPSILRQLGAIHALNLDGGSSTSLYLGGELINRPTATAGRVHNGLGISFKR